MRSRRPLDALLAALRSDGQAGSAVQVSPADCARAVERYLGEGPSVGVGPSVQVGPFLYLTRHQLVRLLCRASGRRILTSDRR